LLLYPNVAFEAEVPVDLHILLEDGVATSIKSEGFRLVGAEPNW
jgi:hypothetical protein